MVVLVNGSPRKEMCTYTALKEVASALERNGIETKIIQASLEKEAIDEAVKEIEASDGIVVGSPVYYASPTGLVLSFLDAVFNRISSSMRLKVGAAVVSCRRGGASSSFDVLNKYFTITNMPVVSSQYWNSVHGRLPGEAEQDAEGLQTMRTLGHNMAWLLKSLKEGGQSRPEREPGVMTSFIR